MVITGPGLTDQQLLVVIFQVQWDTILIGSYCIEHGFDILLSTIINRPGVAGAVLKTPS